MGLMIIAIGTAMLVLFGVDAALGRGSSFEEVRSISATSPRSDRNRPAR